jgi:hypothetical protein
MQRSENSPHCIIHLFEQKFNSFITFIGKKYANFFEIWAFESIGMNKLGCGCCGKTFFGCFFEETGNNS